MPSSYHQPANWYKRNKKLQPANMPDYTLQVPGAPVAGPANMPDYTLPVPGASASGPANMPHDMPYYTLPVPAAPAPGPANQPDTWYEAPPAPAARPVAEDPSGYGPENMWPDQMPVDQPAPASQPDTWDPYSLIEGILRDAGFIGANMPNTYDPFGLMGGLVDWLTGIQGGSDWGDPYGLLEPHPGPMDPTHMEPNYPEHEPMVDYTQYLSDVLMPEVIGRIGEPSPWDVRRDEILEGPTAAIDEHYNRAVENLLNQAGVTGSLGMPLFRGNLTDLERDRMQSQLDIRSQFGQQAAAADEAMRSGRIGDLLAAIQADIARQDSQFGQNLMARRQAGQEYYDWYDRYVRGALGPYDYQDMGLQLLLGGMGHTVQPGQAISGAVGGAGQAGNIYAGLLANLLGMI